MTPEQLKKALEDCISKNVKSRDEEGIHMDMDELLVKTLRSLGYDEAMNIFEKQPKWYN